MPKLISQAEIALVANFKLIKVCISDPLFQNELEKIQQQHRKYIQHDALTILELHREMAPVNDVVFNSIARSVEDRFVITEDEGNNISVELGSLVSKYNLPLATQHPLYMYLVIDEFLSLGRVPKNAKFRSPTYDSEPPLEIPPIPSSLLSRLNPNQIVNIWSGLIRERISERTESLKVTGHKELPSQLEKHATWYYWSKVKGLTPTQISVRDGGQIDVKSISLAIRRFSRKAKL